MKRKLQGRYTPISTVSEPAKAFIPNALPPRPPIEWTPELRSKFDQALVALGRLDSLSVLLPESSLFLYMYVRKEAVLSSMIEGTQSSLSDLLLFELDQQPGAPLGDVQEVSSYVAALEHGLKRLREGFPLSLRLIKEIHEILLAKGRDGHKTPGEFRRTQNWIGGTRPGNAAFVPPPAEYVMECMGALELFLHDQPEPTPVLLKAALSHVQFETIHPFLDDNGRLGRLLITLILCEQKVLSTPILYLSLYFKSHRGFYYELLNRVRQTGDWEAWLDFFADAVQTTASQAVEAARQLMALAKEDRDKIKSLGRTALSVEKTHQALLSKPLATSVVLAQRTGLTPATVNKCLTQLMRLGVVREITEQRRNRIFCYQRYLDVMNQGTELPQ
ncbi:filamentation induced by cAMP protein Fic [Desulfarculus baarsii DSM 2075]|uniref:Filamentation induced by cAMP protein Fic n=1 Tax=Desulfarculus baarsii (strain ATCC 33931 / DSM 2075 / LMG 7858 / VKM B-1802 / 2st14) TaxID=644282 RepID=E1QG60_DESB2|nr:Fic family protein [Desulfarculus baarsii]ADK83572.1 filamentation induced by cAMP protein Fic [Desulfarculus baarsii DSM 2075]